MIILIMRNQIHLKKFELVNKIYHLEVLIKVLIEVIKKEVNQNLEYHFQRHKKEL